MNLSSCFFNILKPYLEDRHFLISHGEVSTGIYPICPTIASWDFSYIYCISMTYLLIRQTVITETFADGIVVLASQTLKDLSDTAK